MPITNSQPAGYSDTAGYSIIIVMSISYSQPACYSDSAGYSIIMYVSIYNSQPAGYWHIAMYWSNSKLFASWRLACGRILKNLQDIRS